MMMNFDKVAAKKLHFLSETIERNRRRRGSKTHPFAMIFAHKPAHTLRMISLKSYDHRKSHLGDVVRECGMKLMENMIHILVYEGLHWFLQ